MFRVRCSERDRLQNDQLGDQRYAGCRGEDGGTGLGERGRADLRDRRTLEIHGEKNK